MMVYRVYGILVILVVSSLCAAYGDEVITGLTYDNKIVQLKVSTGMVSIIANTLIKNPEKSVGTSCAKANNFFSFLTRTKSDVGLLTFDLFANTSFNNDLPFYPQKSSEEFLLGLDFYMDSTNSQRNISIVGPDEIQFIHMIEAELVNKKLAYVDILQYSTGLRLERGQSIFDTKQNQQWLQVVFDVSKNISAARTIVEPKIYLKRYDITEASVIDIIPDVGNSAIVEFDKETSSVYTIGWCTQKQKRCLFKVENMTESASPSPKLSQLFELPQSYRTVMSGVSTIDTDNHILYFVSGKDFSHIPQSSTLAPLVTCNSGGICKRYGDATYGTLVESKESSTHNFVIVGINFINGKIVSENPLFWEGSEKDKTMLLKCGK